MPSSSKVCRRFSAALSRSCAYVPALGTRENPFAALAFSELPARLKDGRAFVGALALSAETQARRHTWSSVWPSRSPTCCSWGGSRRQNKQVSSQNLRASATPVSLGETLSSARFLKRSLIWSTLLCDPRTLVIVTVSVGKVASSMNQEGLRGF